MFICLENKHITGALKLDAPFTYKYKTIKELGYQNIKLQWSQRRMITNICVYVFIYILIMNVTYRPKGSVILFSFFRILTIAKYPKK